MIVFDLVMLNNLIFLLLLAIVSTALLITFFGCTHVLYCWSFNLPDKEAFEKGAFLAVYTSACCWSLFSLVSLIKWFSDIWH